MKEVTLRNRTLARIQAFQVLFQAEATGVYVDDVIQNDPVLTEGPLVEYARSLVLGATDHIEKIDELMTQASRNWSLDRINFVDRNILRIAIYEMLFVDDIDLAVSIDEAVTIAKVYGTDNSYAFVNGILRYVANTLNANEAFETVAEASIQENRADENTVVCDQAELESTQELSTIEQDLLVPQELQ